MNLLEQIKNDRKTAILLITHDLALVREHADKVSVMYSGRIIESAPAKEFFEHPNHPYSLALLNSIPANRNKTLDTITGQPPSIQQIIEGCKFHPRCKNCMEICTEKVPPEYTAGQNHVSVAVSPCGRRRLFP